MRCLSPFLCILLLAGCSGSEVPDERRRAPHPWLVVGVDGGEWSVIRELWDEGRLPHLRGLAQRGTTATLRTHYAASPVIWTTVATGMLPAEHGIVDFVVPTPAGDIPVSSSVRRVPAIWNMLTRADMRVGVLGWWASWPAEEVNGVVVSDRAWMNIPDGVSPPEVSMPKIEAGQGLGFGGGNEASRLRDEGVASLAQQMVAEDYDLLLTYFRGVDIASHNHWRCYRSSDFPDEALAPHGDENCGQNIPQEYEAVDRALGAMLAAAPNDINVLVISDHGFIPARRDIVKVDLDLDKVLERLELLKRNDDGTINYAASVAYTFGSSVYQSAKQVRFGGVSRARDKLVEALARVEFQIVDPTGEVRRVPAFRLRKARSREKGDIVVRVRVRSATSTLLLDGDPEPFRGLIGPISRISGTHDGKTHGILLAAGPDIATGVDISGISIFDIAPTLLYGLGLPVAENFVGRPWLELFPQTFQERWPVRTIPAWKIPRSSGDVTPSAVDEEIMRELGALGYLE